MCVCLSSRIRLVRTASDDRTKEKDYWFPSSYVRSRQCTCVLSVMIGSKILIEFRDGASEELSLINGILGMKAKALEKSFLN